MGKKVKVSVVIDKEVYEKSHALGVNVSRACTNYLKQLNEAIEAANNPNKSFLASDSFTKEAEWTGRDLNPRLLDCESNPKPNGSGDSLFWVAFEKWLTREGQHKPYVARYMVSYAKTFRHCLQDKNLDALLSLAHGKKRLVMASLSALAKFTGVYDCWKSLVKQYSLKWSGKSKDQVVIERLTSIRDPEEIWTWICSVKRELPGLIDFMDLMAVSGLRFGEAVNSYNLIIKLSASEGVELVLNNNGKTRTTGYYNTEKSTLEHFWFEELFLRHTKKAFISFVPKELVAKIGKNEPLNLYGVQTAVKRCVPLRFSDVREAHGTFLTKFLKPSEIDFLHGRVTGSVFMANYFNPALIGDLKTRVFQGIAEIMEKVAI